MAGLTLHHVARLLGPRAGAVVQDVVVQADIAEGKGTQMDFDSSAWTFRGNVRVSTARDGDEALVMALEQEFDAAVVDVMLPGRSGIELVRELRSAGRA